MHPKLEAQKGPSLTDPHIVCRVRVCTWVPGLVNTAMDHNRNYSVVATWEWVKFSDPGAPEKVMVLANKASSANVYKLRKVVIPANELFESV